MKTLRHPHQMQQLRQLQHSIPFQFFPQRFFHYAPKAYNAIELDTHLRKTLDYLKNRWFDPKVGTVGCALIDGQRAVYDTTRLINGLWSHAEYNAYHQYLEKFGPPSSSASMVVTLSPCIKLLPFSHPKPCMKLLQEKSIKRIHIGKLDIFHAVSIQAYQSAGFDITLTQDKDLLQICDNLFRIIQHHGDMSPQELTTVKKSLGDSIFEPAVSTVPSSSHCYPALLFPVK